MKLGEHFIPFDQMIANAAALDVPDGVGIVILYSDGPQWRMHTKNLAWAEAEKLIGQGVSAMKAQQAAGAPAPTDGGGLKLVP